MSIELSIVIPVFNEAEYIGTLIPEIVAALGQHRNYEILVVDDASTDNSRAVLTGLQQHANLRIFRHISNRGQSTSVLTGVRHARGAWVLTMDGDGQNDPADIPRMLQARDASVELDQLKLVAGIRRKRRDTLAKRWGSKIAKAVRGGILGDRFPDTGCGLKLFHRDYFLELPHFDHMHRFLPALYRRQNGIEIGVDVGHRQRRAGLSKYGTFDRLRVGIVDLLGVYWLIRRPCQVNAQEIR